MTTSDDATRGAPDPQHRLRATLLSGDRLFPITVTAISENGFAAEGVSLDGLDEEFLLEMTLPPIGDAAWSPKAPSTAARMAVARLRARARLADLAPSDAGTSVCKGLAGTFQEMSDGCRSALRGWLARLSGAQRPITKGCGPRFMP
jgi:hypothetical protein